MCWEMCLLAAAEATPVMFQQFDCLNMNRMRTATIDLLKQLEENPQGLTLQTELEETKEC